MIARNYPHFLLAIGVVVAMVAAAKLPEEGQAYPDTLPWFVLGLSLGIAGVVSWHLSISRQRALATPSEVRDDSDPFFVIDAIQGPVTQLAQTSKTLDSASLTACIDRLISEFVDPFTENRKEVITRFGMRRGAEVLADFALGERLLNRAWSASADGYSDEAAGALDEAQVAFSQVANRVRRFG